ncbi:hypothetical protein PHLH4_29340 [Pseudomonas sp. St316]|nr:hypothetical protein PHLH4_29340 [Pseudomonas sp. St316]
MRIENSVFLITGAGSGLGLASARELAGRGANVVLVPMVVIRDLNVGHEQLNVHGGACALGHPIGASGARVVVTLVNALRQNTLKRGIASVCIGGGEATAIAIELLS